MRSTRTRKRPRITSTSCSPTRPPVRWPAPRPSSGRERDFHARGSDRRKASAACARVSQAMPIALILAAGSGERLGAEEPKALVELAGRPLLQWSVDVLREVVGIERIVIALPLGSPAPAGVIGLDGRTIAVAGGAVRSE